MVVASRAARARRRGRGRLGPARCRRCWRSGLGVAILSSAIPYSLELEALRRMPTGLFGVLMSLEPAVAALAGFILLGEELVAREIVAIALVVAASAGASRESRLAPRDA